LENAFLGVATLFLFATFSFLFVANVILVHDWERRFLRACLWVVFIQEQKQEILNTEMVERRRKNSSLNKVM
jgi:hypothetical protein